MYSSASACWACSGCWAAVAPCFCVWHACSQVSLHLSEQVCLCLADNSGGNGAQTNNSERLIPLIMNVSAKPLYIQGHGPPVALQALLMHFRPYRDMRERLRHGFDMEQQP